MIKKYAKGKRAAFTPPMPAKRHSSTRTPNPYKAASRAVGQKYNYKLDPASAADVGKVGVDLRKMAGAAYHVFTKDNVKTAIHLINAFNDVTSQGDDVARSQMTTSAVAPVEGGQARRVIEVKHITGKGPTRSVKRIAAQNQAQKVVLYDTLRDQQGSSDARARLSLKGNWNGMMQVYPSPGAYTTYNDVFSMYPVNTLEYEVPQNRIVRVYANSLYFQDEYWINNNNTYHPVSIKTDLMSFRGLGNAQSPEAAIRASMNTIPTIQSTDAMPVILQQSDIPVNYGGNCAFPFVNVDPQSSGMRTSQTFQTRFESAVKTGWIRLDPGDTLHYIHRHYSGPGVRLDRLVELIQAQAISNASPLSYFPMWDIKGTTCTLVNDFTTDTRTSPRYRHVGLSPCNVSFEYRRSAAAALQSPTDGYLAPGLDPEDAEGTWNTGKYSIRLYQTLLSDDKINPVKKFFMPPANIIAKSSERGTNTWIIPVSSDSISHRSGVTKRSKLN